MTMRFEFHLHSRIIFGNHSIQRAGEIASSMGRHALLVRGSGRVPLHPLTDQLRAAGVSWVEYAVGHEPDVEVISAGLSLAKAAVVDHLIAFGGGSVMDTAKAIAALLTNPGELNDYLEVVGKGMPVDLPGLPLLAIPTTSGTGSEVTRNAVVSLQVPAVKVSMRGKGMGAKVALVDPTLTYSLPPNITAQSGMDALTQVIEAYCSKNASPLTDAIALDGILRGSRSILTAYRNGQDPAAREDMALTSLYSGIALSQAGLGAVHGFAGVLGAMVGAAHGAICACLLPAVLKANLGTALGQSHEPLIDKFRRMAEILSDGKSSEPDEVAIWARTLCRKLHIPGLAELGVRRSDFPEIISRAAASSSMQKNPFVLPPEILKQILDESWSI